MLGIKGGFITTSFISKIFTVLQVSVFDLQRPKWSDNVYLPTIMKQYTNSVTHWGFNQIIFMP